MELRKELEGLGVNVKEGLDRVMGDESLYEMMLGMFTGSVNDNPIRMEDFDGADLDGVIQTVHMLKGVTGNLGMAPLFNAYTESLGLLREGRGKEAGEVYKKMLPAQQAILECIARHQSAQ